MKFGRVVFEICEFTDRHTDRHANTLVAIPRTPYQGLSIDDYESIPSSAEKVSWNRI